MKIQLLFAVPIALTIAGCTDVQSSDIKTAGMSAYMSVTADGSGSSTAIAQLNVDDNLTDFVTLSSGDSLVTSVGGQSQTMSRLDVLNDISYSTSFDGQDGTGSAYTVAFNRTSDTSAPLSTCTLPAPFALTSPASGSSFSRSSAIAVSYDGAGTSDGMSYSVSGGCVGGPVSSGVSGDTGSFSIPSGTITPTDASHATETCQVILTVTRARPGQLDPAFGSGGSIRCMQARTITLTSTP
jgi:hypothetical protein